MDHFDIYGAIWLARGVTWNNGTRLVARENAEPLSIVTARGNSDGFTTASDSGKWLDTRALNTECFMAQHRQSLARHGEIHATERRGEFTKVSHAVKSVNNITRAEFAAATNEIRDNVRLIEIQFRRMAQMQADIDHLKASVTRLTRG